MNPPPFSNNENNNLNTLAILHYVLGGLLALFSFFPLIYLGLGIFFLKSPEMLRGNPAHPNQEPPPEFFGWIFVGIGVVGFLVLMTIAICMIMAGRKLSKRTGYTFAFVVACIECLFMPLGTALGVFTIVELNKDYVKRLFDNDQRPGGLNPPATY